MSIYVDIHIIQSLPPSCVNRDDSGSPKSAVYGGVRRLRVSSQSWKQNYNGIRFYLYIFYFFKYILVADDGVEPHVEAFRGLILPTGNRDSPVDVAGHGARADVLKEVLGEFDDIGTLGA